MTDKRDFIQLKVEPPNGGYGWVVVGASFLCAMIVHGIANSFGIFLIHLIDYYGASNGDIAWIGSLLKGITLVLGFLAGILIEKYGCRIVIIMGSFISAVAFLLSTFAEDINVLKFSYGIMGGVGFGLISFTADMSVPPYFTTKRGVALGIAMSGSSFGCFVFPALMHFLLEHYSWQGTLYISSGIILNCLVFGGLMRPLRSNFKPQWCNTVNYKSSMKIQDDSCKDNKNSTAPEQSLMEVNDETKRMSNYEVMYKFPASSKYGFCCYNIFKDGRNGVHVGKSLMLLKNKPLLLLCAVNAFALTGYPLPLVYLPHSTILKGIDPDRVAFLLPVLGISNLFGKVILGYVGDKAVTTGVKGSAICLGVSGIFSSLIPFCYNYAVILTVTSLIGFFHGGFSSLTPISLIEIVGLSRLPNSSGLIYLFRGVGAIIGPPFCGYIFDAKNSYDIPFYMTGSLSILGGILIYLVSCPT